MDIDVVKVCGTDIISREAGKKIRELLLTNWAESELRLIFSGRKIASVSFFDEAFGLLLKRGGKPLDEVRRKLKFPDITESDKKLLNKVMITRIEENRV